MSFLKRKQISRLAALVTVIALISLVAVACGSSDPEFDSENFDPFTSVPVELVVNSPEWGEGEEIPVKFTCDGSGEVPVVSWQRPPNGTRAVAVIFDDPDAPNGIFSHWVVFNIPPGDNRLSGSVSEGDRNATGPFEGQNDFGEHGYGGPCPPSGETHEYRFNVFALIAPLALDEDATATEVLTAMRGSVIGHGVLTGSYTRS